MSKVLVLNGAQPYPFAKGELNAALADRAAAFFEARGDEVRRTTTANSFDTDEEIDHHQWAEIIVMQFPINWMGVPWSFKRYMDSVYSAGMDGRLCNGDGRSAAAPTENYGMGGTQGDTRYMLSVTFNAPSQAFDDPAEPFFEGMSVDDLLRPMHLNAKFFGMKPLPTFSAHDVMKNPAIENDFKRFDHHLQNTFGDL
ncbi:NAD(P)H-dependent oxidoreductase [Halomonas denitrificans]|nr:NAD(P)H-dependent oxidoreductase [Halomonas denitrificans]